jgi:hypothetical protein
MELSEEESQKIGEYRQREIDKINSSNLTDEQKKDRLSILETEQYHKVIPLRIKEIAPHQWEAY